MPLVITRKDHVCDACGEVIPKGSIAIYWESKTPRYNPDDYYGDNQIGIEFHKGWTHRDGDRCEYNTRKI